MIRASPSWRQRGVEALRQATLLDGVPPWLPNLAAQMLTRQGGDALALRHLEQSYAVTNDPAAREQIARKLKTCADRRWRSAGAGGDQLHQLIDERYPYAPESFSLVAGPRFDFSGGSGGTTNARANPR